MNIHNDSPFLPEKKTYTHLIHIRNLKQPLNPGLVLQKR